RLDRLVDDAGWPERRRCGAARVRRDRDARKLIANRTRHHRDLAYARRGRRRRREQLPRDRDARPAHGGASAVTIIADPFIQWSWIFAHGHEIWTSTVQHVVLTVVPVSAGIAISLPVGILAERHRRLYNPVIWITG